MICFMKIQSENIKITWNIILFIFCMIYSFSKCEGFTDSRGFACLLNRIVLVYCLSFSTMVI